MSLIKTLLISVISTSLLLCGNAFAKPGDDKQPVVVDVNVVNTAPIPVIVENDVADSTEFVSVEIRELVNAPTARVSTEVYFVPPGKMLIAEYVSIYLDVVVRNRPESGLRLAGSLSGIGSTGSVGLQLGYMEEFVRTSRGTPNFIIARNVTGYFYEGAVSCTANSYYAGSDLDFGAINCSLSGRLIDAP